MSCPLKKILKSLTWIASRVRLWAMSYSKKHEPATWWVSAQNSCVNLDVQRPSAYSGQVFETATFVKIARSMKILRHSHHDRKAVCILMLYFYPGEFWTITQVYTWVTLPEISDRGRTAKTKLYAMVTPHNHQDFHPRISAFKLDIFVNCRCD
jgi:hypothetical protein